MISIIKFKKCMANASIFDIIIGKLNYWEKLYLFILFEVNKNLEIGFY